VLTALLSCIVVAACCGPILRRVAPYGGWVAGAVPAALFAFFLHLGWSLPADGAHLAGVAWVPSLGVSLSLRLDGFSWLFTLIITGIGTLVAIYAGAYFGRAADASARFLRLILLFMSMMLGAVLADDLISLFMFWEATSFLSFLLIGFHAERPGARKAALQGLLVTAGGGLALLAGILLLGTTAGTFSLAGLAAQAPVLAASPVAIPALLLVVTGACTKSAQFPFHFWLPAAMEAPTPASAYLHSATMVKLGVYLLARFDGVFAEVAAFGPLLVAIGSITMLIAATRAVMSATYKAVLAESTVASLALLVVLIGVRSEAAASAAVVFILAHALYKAALFFCAGTVIHVAHDDRLARLAGLGRVLPGTAAAAALAALAMAGLPPTLAFTGKEMVLDAHLHAGNMLGLVATMVASTTFVAIAVVAGVRPFVGRREGALPAGPQESPGLLAAPLVLAVVGVVFGLGPALSVGSVVDAAAGALRAAPHHVSLALWHGATPSLALSAVVVASGLVVAWFWDRLHARLSAVRPLVSLLGDAGYRRVYDGILALAGVSTRVLQSGDQHRYSSFVLWFVVGVTAVTLAGSGGPLPDGISPGPADAPSAIVLVVMAAGAVAAARASSLLTALIAVGVVGFGLALIFLMNGAPDLALTQFAVEVLVVVIFAALLLRIPLTGATRTRRERWHDGVLGAAVGAVVFVALTTMIALPFDARLTEYFATTSYVEAHGRNVVNVILVDYRGLDTVGEITVVALATLGVWSLLRRVRPAGGR
jgi:multicomponent Na+:H+ antiporter subunit A